MFNEEWEDSYFPDPGTVETAKCGICGDYMDVKRACDGPTSFVMVMSRSKRKYDNFYCSNRGRPWHNQLIDLKHEIEKASSVKIWNMLMEEAVDILREREPSLVKYNSKVKEIEKMDDMLKDILGEK